MVFEKLPRFCNSEKLSPRQLEVVAYLVHGFSSKEIARELHASPRTIECHRFEVMKRLGARNAVDLTRIVYSLHQGQTMFEHDDDDPPPVDTFLDVWFGYFNRMAEEMARIARSWGLLP